MTCGFCCFEEWADLSLKNPKSKFPCGMLNLYKYFFSKYNAKVCYQIHVILKMEPFLS